MRGRGGPSICKLRSAKFGPLEPKLVLFGHGAPLRDTRKFVEFVRGLPD